jgi:hypothetical protein
MPAINRRQIIRACKSRGWTIQPAALECIEKYLENDVRAMHLDKQLLFVLDCLSVEMKPNNKRIVTVHEIITVLQPVDNDEAVLKRKEKSVTHNIQPTDASTSLRKNAVSAFSPDFRVISAFQLPRLSYDSIRKQFRLEEGPFPILGNAEDKVRLPILPFLSCFTCQPFISFLSLLH